MHSDWTYELFKNFCKIKNFDEADFIRINECAWQDRKHGLVFAIQYG